MFNFKTILKGLLAISIVIAGLGVAAQPAQATSSEPYHIVARGETLSRIAQSYGINWRDLADYNKLTDPSLIYPGQQLYLTYQATVSSQTQSSTIPTIEFLSVKRNHSVIVRVSNFPDNDTLRVTMGPSGSKGIDGIRVGTVSSGKGGSFTDTFDIPTALKDTGRIVIRFQSSITGFYAYNTFTNSTFGSGVERIPQPDFDTRTSNQVSKKISYQEQVDIWLGNSGVYLPSSAYTGWLVLSSTTPDDSYVKRGHHFIQRWIDVRIYNNDAVEFKQLYGLVYVYFNLNRQTRAAWDAGELSIYHFDAREGKWVEYPTHLVTTKNWPYGRVTCYASQFGTYGLVQAR
jgi:murein DD-endopeptidase MepM/ murein hydrolase activator NlpD